MILQLYKSCCKSSGLLLIQYSEKLLVQVSFTCRSSLVVTIDRIRVNIQVNLKKEVNIQGVM